MCAPWAAQYNTWLLITLTPKGVVFPFLSLPCLSFSSLLFSFLLCVMDAYDAGAPEAQEAQQVAVHAHNLEAQAHAHAEAQVQAAVQAHSLAAKAQAHAHAQVRPMAANTPSLAPQHAGSGCCNPAVTSLLCHQSLGSETCKQ